MKKVQLAIILIFILFLSACGSKKVTNNELVESEKSSETVFSEIYDSEFEDIVIEGVEGNLPEEGVDNDLDNYVIQGIINPVLYDEPFTVENNGQFWIVATSIENEEERHMLNINIEGEIFFDIPFIRDNEIYNNISVIDNRYICDNTFSMIYDFDGNDITDSFYGENEEFGGIFKDTTGWTVWGFEIIETYDSYELMLRARDLNGNIKAEWSKNKLKGKYEEANLINEVELIGGSWYRSGNMLISVENNVEIQKNNNYCCADNDYVYIYPDGWVSEKNFSIWDKNGNNITPSLELLETYGSRWVSRNLGEGIMMFKNHSDYIVMDSKGNIPFDINVFTRRGVWGDDISINEFCDGKAQVEIENERGTRFTTIIDSSGEFLFEPIEENSIAYDYYENMWKYKYSLYRDEGDETVSYLFDDEGDLIKRSSELYIKEDDELTLYVTIENGKLAAYPVEHIEK